MPASGSWAWGSRNSGGTPASLATTALNGLASGSAVTIAFANDTDKDKNVILELVVGFGSAPAANATVDVYPVLTIDGTNYEDASASRPPTGWPAGAFVLDNTTSQRKMCVLTVPPRGCNLLLVNNAGQAFNGSGNTLKAFAYNDGIN